MEENNEGVEDMKKRETMMNVFAPSDIVREILLHLPCKSLCRFRCVSKQWCSWINDDRFMEEHRKRNMKASHIIGWDRTKLQLFSLSMDSYAHIKTINTYKYDRMLPPSHGMVCLHGWENKEIALFNPCYQEIIPLPNLLERPFNNLGFGFDSRSRRYKIVQLIAYEKTITRFHIMTVTRNGSYWRSVHVVKPSKIRVETFGSESLCVNGVLYWNIWNTQTDTNFVVFDLSTEEMHIIESPAPWGSMPDYPTYHGKLALLEGKLCCFNMTPINCTSTTMNIWKYDNLLGWTPCYQFEIPRPVLLSFKLIPLHIYNNKTILFQEKSYSQNVQRLYIYHIEDQTLKIYPTTNNEGGAYGYDLIVYSETMNRLLDWQA